VATAIEFVDPREATVVGPADCVFEDGAAKHAVVLASPVLHCFGTTVERQEKLSVSLDVAKHHETGVLLAELEQLVSGLRVQSSRSRHPDAMWVVTEGC
jgi:hypothetical protein